MPPTPSSALAFVTSIHLGFVVLRKHRLPPGVIPWALLPSLFFCAAPWLFPPMGAVAAGLAIHLAWFVACEKLIPVPAAGPRATAGEGGRPAAAPDPAPRRPMASGVRSEPGGFTSVPVLVVLDESPSVRTFRLSRPPGFAFEAGQFLTVRAQVDGTPHVRCYSISSAPESTGYIEISVKRQGQVSAFLHATLRPGAQLQVKPPAGRFTYPAGDDRPIVLIAGGVGITPLISMLRHGVVADPGRPITLFYSARSRSELAFLDELEWLSGRHPHVRIVATVTEPGGGWQGHAGRIDAALIADHVTDLGQSVFLMCGPLDMIDAVRSGLLGMGVPEAQVRSEVFQAATAVGARPSPEAAPAASVARLALSRSGRAVDVAAGQTLLDAAEAAGADIPTLCRAGVCGTCRTRVVSGDVRCTSDALGERDRQAGFVLPCVTWPLGDCVLEA